MAQQMGNGFAQNGQQGYGSQAQGGQWTWYRQYPTQYPGTAQHPGTAPYTGYPGTTQYGDTTSLQHIRMTQQILELTRENQRLLRELHMLMQQGKTVPYGSYGTAPLRESSGLTESGSIQKPSSERDDWSHPSKPVN